MEASCLQRIDIIGGRKRGFVLRMQTKISSFYEPSSTPKSPPNFNDDGEENNELTTPYPKKIVFFFVGDEVVLFLEKELEVVIIYNHRALNPDRYDAAFLSLDFISFVYRFGYGHII